MSFYSEMAATASEMLSEFGQTVTITHTSDGTYDPATGATTPATNTFTAKAAIFDVAQEDIDGTLIRAGDELAYTEAVQKPVTGDTMTDAGGTTYTVLKVKGTAPAGLAVLYEVFIRR